jgi:hypothetical protein
MAQASATMLQQFEKETGIKHRFCDPNSRERKEHGIGELDHDKRERYWIEQIKDYKDRKVLFVCAYDHFDSFAEKLTAAGFTVKREHKMQRISAADLIRAAWLQQERGDPSISGRRLETRFRPIRYACNILAVGDSSPLALLARCA